MLSLPRHQPPAPAGSPYSIFEVIQMKKIYSILLSVTLLLSLTSCGSQTTPAISSTPAQTSSAASYLRRNGQPRRCEPCSSTTRTKPTGRCWTVSPRRTAPMAWQVSCSSPTTRTAWTSRVTYTAFHGCRRESKQVVRHPSDCPADGPGADLPRGWQGDLPAAP